MLALKALNLSYNLFHVKLKCLSNKEQSIPVYIVFHTQIFNMAWHEMWWKKNYVRNRYEAVEQELTITRESKEHELTPIEHDPMTCTLLFCMN